MHYHLEVIMPPSNDIQATLEEILKPFSENERDNEDYSGHAFWDFFVVGGRWAGTKESCTYDSDKLEQFYKQINEAKITVSSVQCGKRELQPSSQIPVVDKMWNDLFPTENGEITPCPIFAHSNNQYDGNSLISCDICRVDEIPDSLNCSRVIIAGLSYDDSVIEAKFMFCEDQWNGVNHMPIDWDGNVKNAIEKYVKTLSTYKEDYKEKLIPKPNWICVTVDYHS